MIKAYPKQLSLFILILLITFGMGYGSDEPTKNGPNNIVSIGYKPGVGDVLMNVNVNKGNVISYELYNDLGIGGFYSHRMNEVTQQAEFVIVDNSINNYKHELLSYIAKTDEVERTALNVNDTDYYWNYGVSSSKYVALRGMEVENIEDSFVTIVDRETNTSKVLLACEGCYGAATNFNPMIIQGDLLFALFLTDTNHLLAVFDLSNETKIYGIEFTSYPSIIVGDDHIYQYDGSSSMIQVYTSRTFENAGSYSLPYFVNSGLSGSVNNKAIVYQTFPQPTLISSAPQVIELSTGDVIHGFSYNDLTGNLEEFSEKTGLLLSFPPAIDYLDFNRNFVLYSGYQSAESGTDYAYISSNYESKYQDHISLPFQPEEVIAVSW